MEIPPVQWFDYSITGSVEADNTLKANFTIAGRKNAFCEQIMYK